jgi:hypothetical protein
VLIRNFQTRMKRLKTTHEDTKVDEYDEITSTEEEFAQDDVAILKQFFAPIDYISATLFRNKPLVRHFCDFVTICDLFSLCYACKDTILVSIHLQRSKYVSLRFKKWAIIHLGWTAEQLQQIEKEKTTILSGSILLQFILGTRWENSDVDIYICEKDVSKSLFLLQCVRKHLGTKVEHIDSVTDEEIMSGINEKVRCSSNELGPEDYFGIKVQSRYSGWDLANIHGTINIPKIGKVGLQNQFIQIVNKDDENDDKESEANEAKVTRQIKKREENKSKTLTTTNDSAENKETNARRKLLETYDFDFLKNYWSNGCFYVEDMMSILKRSSHYHFHYRSRFVETSFERSYKYQVRKFEIPNLLTSQHQLLVPDAKPTSKTTSKPNSSSTIKVKTHAKGVTTKPSSETKKPFTNKIKIQIIMQRFEKVHNCYSIMTSEEKEVGKVCSTGCQNARIYLHWEDVTRVFLNDVLRTDIAKILCKPASQIQHQRLVYDTFQKYIVGYCLERQKIFKLDTEYECYSSEPELAEFEERHKIEASFRSLLKSMKLDPEEQFYTLLFPNKVNIDGIPGHDILPASLMIPQSKLYSFIRKNPHIL